MDANYYVLSPIYTPFWGIANIISPLIFVEYFAVILLLYYDLKSVQANEKWITSKKGWILGVAFLPFLNILIAINYLYQRHLKFSQPKTGYFSHSTQLIGGSISAVMASVLLPIIFGPVGFIAGYRIRKQYDETQGGQLMILSGVTTVVGWLLGYLITATGL